MTYIHNYTYLFVSLWVASSWRNRLRASHLQTCRPVAASLSLWVDWTVALSLAAGDPEKHHGRLGAFSSWWCHRVPWWGSAIKTSLVATEICRPCFCWISGLVLAEVIFSHVYCISRHGCQWLWDLNKYSIGRKEKQESSGGQSQILWSCQWKFQRSANSNWQWTCHDNVSNTPTITKVCLSWINVINWIGFDGESTATWCFELVVRPYNWALLEPEKLELHNAGYGGIVESGIPRNGPYCTRWMMHILGSNHKYRKKTCVSLVSTSNDCCKQLSFRAVWTLTSTFLHTALTNFETLRDFARLSSVADGLYVLTPSCILGLGFEMVKSARMKDWLNEDMVLFGMVRDFGGFSRISNIA